MSPMQNLVLWKTLSVVKGSAGRKVNAIATVEDVETFASAV